MFPETRTICLTAQSHQLSAAKQDWNKQNRDGKFTVSAPKYSTTLAQARAHLSSVKDKTTEA